MREMDGPTPRKSSHSAVLLIGILLTCLAVVGHRFLPQRRLVLESTHDLVYAFLMQSGNGPPADIQWIDQSHFHFACQFPQATVEQGCAFGYQLHSEKVDQGTDLSHFKTLNLAIRYTGNAKYLRVAIRNFDARFSKVEDLNSPKYNFVNIPSRDLAKPVAIKLSEFWVPEWWIAQYDLPRSLSQPDLSNATIFSFDLRGDLGGSHHDIQIDKIEFVGDWISAESWYLGILCVLVVFSTTYGGSQWLLLRRKHREQRRKIDDLESEKENYRKLSTLDALTNVLNRHGIERFVENLQVTRVPASVIVIDIDNFKDVNDRRGHYGGDRVLRKMGEILRAHTRNTDGLGRWEARSSCSCARARAWKRPRSWPKSCGTGSRKRTSSRMIRCRSPPASVWRLRRPIRVSRMRSGRPTRRCTWPRTGAETVSSPRRKTRCTR